MHLSLFSPPRLGEGVDRLRSVRAPHRACFSDTALLLTGEPLGPRIGPFLMSMISFLIGQVVFLKLSLLVVGFRLIRII